MAEIRGFMDAKGFLFTVPGGGDPMAYTWAQLESELCTGYPFGYMLASVGSINTDSGHMVLISDIDAPVGPPTITFYDPNPLFNTWATMSADQFAVDGPNGRGPWVAYTCTWYYAGTPNPVSDIQSFSVTATGHNVNLSFAIQPAQGSQYAAVYVSDNPDGPARLVDALTDHAVYLPQTNAKTDTYRLPPGEEYFYWLDFNYGPFADVRDPYGLFSASGTAIVSGTARAHFGAPSAPVATDIPFDRGGSIAINWQLSADDAVLDSYHIYRNTYPPGQPQDGEWYFLAAVNRGVASYVDETAVSIWTTQYQVAAAHHGAYPIVTGQGNQGIWHEFTPVFSGLAVDNFWNDQISLVSNDTTRVCPAGLDETLEAEIAIWGSNIAPTVGIPIAMIECYPVNGPGTVSQFCASLPLHVDAPTDASGRTTLTVETMGGHGKTDLVFALANSSHRFDTLTVYIKSPDVDGNGIVNVVDFSAFGGAYTSPPKPYSWYLDFTAPFGTIDLFDFAYFGSHNNHQCGGGNFVSDQGGGTSDATIRINLTEVISASGRMLHADLSANELTSFKAALFNLRTDNPMIEYDSWEPGSYEGRVLAVPVVRDGIKEFAIGVLDGEEKFDRTVSLGRIVYRINGKDDLALTPRDFETRAADVLSKDGVVLKASSTAGTTTERASRIVSNGLAQNRPNPFNPTTTLSYSIAKPGRVSLRVFGVDGSLVRTLVDTEQAADRYDVVWDGTNDAGGRVASGVYFYALRTPSFSSTKKMVLLK